MSLLSTGTPNPEDRAFQHRLRDLRRRRRRMPVLGILAFGLTAVIVVGTGLVLSGSLERPAIADAPSPSASIAPPSASVATPRPEPSWRPTGPLPGCEVASEEAPPAQPPARPAQIVREVATQGARVGRPAGIAYAPAGQLLMLIPQGTPDPPPDATSNIGMMTLYGDGAGSVEIATAIREALDTTFDGVGGRLLAFDPETRDLVSVPASAGGTLESSPEAVAHFDLRPLRLGAVTGSTTDPDDGALYLLDSGARRLVRIAADEDDAGRAIPALRDGGVCIVPLDGLEDPQLRGVAADPATGHLFVLGLQTRRLFEIDLAGRIHVIHDLMPLEIGEPLAMTFAPSGDPTEEPGITSLYLLDHLERQEDRAPRDRIIELDLRPLVTPSGPPPATDVHGVLVRTTQTSDWSPVSPDPSGLAYLPDGGFLVSDSEVDETPTFDRVNLFSATPEGELAGTGLSSFTPEPSGLAIDPATSRRFVADDVYRRIFVVDPGQDGVGGTGDDDVSSFDTAAFGSFDPEGLAFADGSLFVADGLGAEVFRISPGPNAVFDGVPATGDDEVSSFDTRSLGQPTPEGLEYAADRNSLFVVSNDRRANLLEVGLDGRPIQVIDLSFLNAVAPAGLAYGPGSVSSTVPSLFIADRGIDNARNPVENDGRVYEIRVVRGGPPNLIANPGMEVDADGDGAIDSWDVETGATRSSDTARSGEASLRIEAPATGLVTDQRLPSMNPNQPYTFAMWVNVPPTDQPISLKVRIRWRDAARTNLGSQRIVAVELATAGWDKFVTNFRSPAGATSAILTLDLETPGTVVYVDDVLLIPIG
jgi:hypothetical protein